MKAKILVIVSMLMIVAMSWMLTASAWDTEGTETIDEDYYWYQPIEFFSGDYLELQFTIDVQNDVYIDVMLLTEENFNKYINEQSFSYYSEGTDFNTLYTNTPTMTFTTYDNYYVVVDNTDDPPNGATPPWNGINDYCTFHYTISAEAYFYPPPDTDGDGVSDDNDAFPYDPNEQYDSDGDGVGDNADYYPNDPTKWKQEPSGGGSGSTWEDDEDESPLLGVLCVLVTGIIIIVVVVGVLLYNKQQKQKAQPPQQPPQPYYQEQQPPPPGYQPPQPPY